MKEVLTFDLDNTIFDTTPVTIEAFRRCNKPYYLGKYFSVKKSYPEDVAEELIRLFSDDIWYNTKLLNDKVPYLINKLNEIYDVYYVSARVGKPRVESLKQLLRNDIHCVLDQIVKVPGNKLQTLKDLKTLIHFDDCPDVIEACLDAGVGCHMISNEDMIYNHYLRDKVNHSKDLQEAITKEKLLEKIRC